MLHYVERRRNLDLGGAAAALDDAYARARTLRPLIEALQQEVARDTEPIKLRETIYLAQIAAEVGSWADFLARLHRFSEGCLQLMAEELGVRWGAKERTSYQAGWWEHNRGMLSGLQLAEAITPADPASENRRREVDRANLRAIVAGLAAAQGRENYLAALEHLAAVDRPVPLRNAIVHRFTPISQVEVAQKAGMDVSQLLGHMREAYCQIFGVAVSDAHPYQQVNALCRRIVDGER